MAVLHPAETVAGNRGAGASSPGYEGIAGRLYMHIIARKIRLNQLIDVYSMFQQYF